MFKGSKSFGYRLTPKYVTEGRRQSIRTSQFSRIIARERAKENHAITLPVHKHLRDQLGRVEIDDFIQDLPPQHAAAVSAIHDKEMFFSVDRFGRVHTNMTNLPSELRNNLSVDGKRLISMDISNSQPLFLALLLINYLCSGSLKFSNFKKIKRNPYLDLNFVELERRCDRMFEEKESSSKTISKKEPTGEGTEGTSPSITMRRLTEGVTRPVVTASENEGQKSQVLPLSEDGENYLRACEEGRFYEMVMDAMEVGDYPRDSFKVDLFANVFYCKPYSNKYRSAFRKLFPNVLAFMDKLKKKDFAHLAHLMQNYESTFIIGHVCRRIMQEMPEAPILTIHDSIMTTADYAERCQEIFEEEFYKIGIQPSFKISEYGR